MRNAKLMLLVPALAGAAMLEGCQTWGPTWSELTGARYNVTIVNRRPTSINMVDNQGAFPLCAGAREHRGGCCVRGHFAGAGTVQPAIGSTKSTTGVQFGEIVFSNCALR